MKASRASRIGELKQGVSHLALWLVVVSLAMTSGCGSSVRDLQRTSPAAYVTARHPLLSVLLPLCGWQAPSRPGLGHTEVRCVSSTKMLTFSSPHGSATTSTGGLWPPEPGAAPLIHRSVAGARCSRDARPAASTSHLLLARWLMSCSAVIWQQPVHVQAASYKKV